MRFCNVIIYKKVLLLLLLILLIASCSQKTFAQIENNQDSSISQPKAPLKGRVMKIDLTSDQLEYFEADHQFVATGNAVVIIKEQNSKLEAKKITYDQVNQIIIAEDDVKITKNGEVINGNFARVDINKESAMISEPNAVIKQINIVAKTANVYPKNLEVLKGKAVVNNKDLNLTLSSNEYTPGEVIDFNERNAEPLGPDSKPNYRISAQEIIVDDKPDEDVITIKNATVWLGKFKVASIPSLKLRTSSRKSRMETKLPEIGSYRKLGIYFGPGHVFNLPNGATLKAAPIMTVGTKSGEIFGGGLFTRYTSDTNKTEIAYSSMKGYLVARGEQDILTPNTKIQYGMNSYMDNGFFGDRLPGYAIEVVDDRKLGSAMNFDLMSRTSGGFVEDDNTNFSTMKLQLQGSIINNKPLFSIKDYFTFRLVSQYALSVYGNGDKFGMVRGGPNVTSKLGPVTLASTYYQAGVYGETPFEYDRYVYGKSNLWFRGDVKLTKYASLGYLNSLNLTKDNWDKKLLVENQYYARVGPEDFKFRLGYDTVRKRSTFGIDLLLGSGRTGIDFDKLRVIQP